MSWSPDLYTGEMRPWPESVTVRRGQESKTYVPDKVAHKVTHTEDGIVGRCTCDSCGRTVRRAFATCPWCGAKFEGVSE